MCTWSEGQPPFASPLKFLSNCTQIPGGLRGRLCFGVPWIDCQQVGCPFYLPHGRGHWWITHLGKRKGISLSRGTLLKDQASYLLSTMGLLMKKPSFSPLDRWLSWLTWLSWLSWLSRIAMDEMSNSMNMTIQQAPEVYFDRSWGIHTHTQMRMPWLRYNHTHTYLYIAIYTHISTYITTQMIALCNYPPAFITPLLCSSRLKLVLRKGPDKLVTIKVYRTEWADGIFRH